MLGSTFTSEMTSLSFSYSAQCLVRRQSMGAFGGIWFFYVTVNRFPRLIPPVWFALGNLNIISTSSSYDVGDGFLP